MTALFTVVTADGHVAVVGGIGPVTREQQHLAGPRARSGRRAANRALALVAFAALVLPASAPGASAAQPSGAGNAHLAPQTAEAHTYRLVGRVLPRDNQPPPADHRTAWLPLLLFAGLLVSGGGCYVLYTVLYTRRRVS